MGLFKALHCLRARNLRYVKAGRQGAGGTAGSEQEGSGLTEARVTRTQRAEGAVGGEARQGKEQCMEALKIRGLPA